MSRIAEVPGYMRRTSEVISKISQHIMTPHIARITQALVIAVSIPIVCRCQHTSGRILFVDGTQATFQGDYGICCSSVRYDGIQGYEQIPCAADIPVYYQNSWRNLEIDQLHSIEILNYQIGSLADRMYIKNPELIVETKTGITVSYQLRWLASFMVRIRDDLTGELKVQTFDFLSGNQLNIKRIEFRE